MHLNKIHLQMIAGLCLLGLLASAGYWSCKHFLAEVFCSTVPNSTLKRDPSPDLPEIISALGWEPSNAAAWYKLSLRLKRIGPEGLANRDDPEWPHAGVQGLGPPFATLFRQADYQGLLVEVLKQAVRWNPVNCLYAIRLGWEYAYSWEEQDYHERCIPAADAVMEQAALLAGHNAQYHQELGNYWLMRSRMIPKGPARDPVLARAGWHYRKGLSLTRGNARKRMQQQIRKYAKLHVQDEAFLSELLGN